MLILADHNWFRDQFAKLDELQAQAPPDPAALARLWRPLAAKLDVHAYIEEKIFYPQLLKRGANDPEGETLDAIGDHNAIRDAVREASAAVVGSDGWWAAVGRAREANDDHMAEEEREGLTDFRRLAGLQQRHDLAVAFAAYEARNFAGVQPVDKDPAAYVQAAEQAVAAGSLAIGGLKRR